MQVLLKSTLLIIVILLLTFLGFKAVENNTSYINYSKQISKQNDTDHALGGKVDKLLERLTAGIYNKYSKKQEEIQKLELDANNTQKKSLLYL